MTISSYGLSFFPPKVELSTANWLTVDNSDLENFFVRFLLEIGSNIVYDDFVI